jgi:hypothetical protein
MNRKWLLLGVVALCLVPTTLAAKPEKDGFCRPGRCQQVPEGGAGVVYLLGAAITCVGAMLIRSRKDKVEKA